MMPEPHKPLPLDPGQILALSALLEERHVTRAARRVGISQSSMSHRLRALREAIGDPLLVREGKLFVLTERAEQLRAPLALALDALQRVLTEPSSFEPASASFELSLALPDLLAPSVPPLIKLLQREAPRARLRIAPISGDLLAHLADGRVDLAVAPAHFAGPHTRSRPLGDVRFGVVGRRAHPAFQGRLTERRWLAYPHVVVSPGNDAPNVVGDALAAHSQPRRIGLLVQSFLSGLFVVAESDFLMNVPLPLSHQVARRLGLEVRSAPVEIPAVRLAMLWHERSHTAPAHTWFRAKLHSFMRERLVDTARKSA